MVLAAAVFLLQGCGKDPSEKTDAELGLNAQQSQGRRVYQLYCAVCHNAYSSSGSKGPSLKGVFRREYLPSGLVANDRFVGETISRGRKMMPALGTSLNPQQIDDVIAYLHSL